MTFYVVLELLLRIYIYFVGVLYKYDEKDQPSLILPTTPKSKSAESIISKKTYYIQYIIVRNNPKFPIGLVPFFYAVI